MSTLSAIGAPRVDAPDPERSLSRWERLLLAAELGQVGASASAAGEGAPPRSRRDWAVDLTIFAYAALAAAATAANSHGQLSSALFAIDVLLAVPVCLALWARRTHPLAVAWLGVGLSAFSSAALHASQVAIFSAAIHARPRRAVQVMAASLVATAVESAIFSAPLDFLAFELTLTIAAFAFGSFIRVRRLLVLSLQEHSRQLQSEQRLRIHEAQLAERARIAREMHDVLAHRISLLSVHAGALEFNHDTSPEEVAEAAGVIRDNARAAQEELREVIGVLRADPGDGTVEPPQPTFAELGHLVAECREAGMEVGLANQLDGQSPPELVGRTIYRTVQEALTNARKHALGQPVSISIAGRLGESVRVEVVNRPAAGDAWGLVDEQVGSGTGLVGLAERLALAGGSLEHQALLGGGFRLVAVVPWATVGVTEKASAGGAP
jgi:signal transduction histidine kinase